MRIAVLIDAWLPFLGGGQKSVLEVTRILKKKRGINFVVFHSFSNKISFRFLWAFYVILQVIFYHLFVHEFDLIDARAYIAGLPGKIISLILRIPLVYTVNGCSNLDLGKKGFMLLLERILLTKIKYDQQISDSQHFLKHKNVNKNIIVIPNGVDVERFQRVKTKKGKKFTLIYVGRLAKVKGIIYLLKAIKLLAKTEQNFLLEIIGTGEQESELKNYVKRNKLEKLVKFLGEIRGSCLIKEYKFAHLFVLPSLAEGQPITLLEAWAAKLPVIVSRVGSLPYYVSSKNGYLVPPAKAKKLAETILKAFRNKNLRKMGENGFRLVKRDYGWEKTAESYWQVYQELVK